jgi:O-acetyl-ADP-ribose deacetylase (regulator of RNase III)
VKVIDYEPGKKLTVSLHNHRRLLVTVSDLDQTKADVLVRFTDERGKNRDVASEAAIRRVVGPSFDSQLNEGMAQFNDALSPGVAFSFRTASDVPGQTICNTFGPAYEASDTFSAKRLASAFETCFGLGTMGSALSLAYPGYGDDGSGYPIDIAAPVAIASVLAGLERAPRLMQVTMVVREKAFPLYCEALAKQVHVQLKPIKGENSAIDRASNSPIIQSTPKELASQNTVPQTDASLHPKGSLSLPTTTSSSPPAEPSSTRRLEKDGPANAALGLAVNIRRLSHEWRAEQSKIDDAADVTASQRESMSKAWAVKVMAEYDSKYKVDARIIHDKLAANLAAETDPLVMNDFYENEVNPGLLEIIADDLERLGKLTLDRN